jgi:hypothetical protein
MLLTGGFEKADKVFGEPKNSLSNQRPLWLQTGFFGSTYTVNAGTIGFFNPVRIEPVLEMNLETKAK